MDIIEKAKQFAAEKHTNQKRKDGKPYFSHLQSVVDILTTKYSVSEETVAAAYLHDVMEDQGVSKEELQEEFGSRIAIWVDYLTRSNGTTYFDFIKDITESGSSSIKRIKMADLEHNMSDLEEGSLKDKYRFAYWMIQQNF